MSNVISLAARRRASAINDNPARDNPERAARDMAEELAAMIECVEIAIAQSDLITARHALGEIVATSPPEGAPLRVIYWRRREVLRLTLKLVNAECAAG
jgi:hypothetical protein